MATSGLNTFTENRNAIILDALQLIGIYGIGKTVSIEDMTVCSNALNKMVKAFSNKGLQLWCKEEVILFLNQYSAQYGLGNGTGDAMVALKSDCVLTELNGALVAGSTSFTLNTTTGMSINDNIGIVQSDGSTFWSTIATIPTSTTLTINAGITLNALNSAMIYTFTNNIYKPTQVISARLVSGLDMGSTNTISEIIMTSIAYQTYFNIPSPDINGLPTQYTYNPDISDGQIYVWPRPSTTNYRMELSCIRQLQDLDTATDDFDFPAEWLETLTWQLAVRISFAFGKSALIATLGPIASEMLNTLKMYDTEANSIFLRPDLGY